jgi:hypothetical protein
MLELIGIAAVTIIMGRIAYADDQSQLMWVVITFGICLGSLFIPLPFLRILIAGVVSFVLMIVYKMVTEN